MDKTYFVKHKKAQFWPQAQLVRFSRLKFIIIPLYILIVFWGMLSAVQLVMRFIVGFLLPDVLSQFAPFIASNTFTGISVTGFSVSLLFLSFYIYFQSAVKEPTPKIPPQAVVKLIEEGKQINLTDYVSVATLLVIHDAISDTKSSDKNLIDVKALYYALSDEVRGMFVIKRLGLKPKEFLSIMEQFYASRDAQYTTLLPLDKILEYALRVAVVEGHEKILVSDVIAALSQIDPFFEKFLFDRNIKFEDVLNIVYWQTTNEVYEAEKKFNPDRPKLTGGIGKEWAMGYALALQRFAFDLSETVLRQQTPIHLIGRSNETQEMEKILVRATKHNVLLVGDPGVGKSTIVRNLARRVGYSMTYPVLSNKRVMQVNLDYLLAGASDPGTIIERLNSVLNDAVSTGNIILYIENVHALFAGGGGKVGAVDASDVLIPYLENPELFFVATTNTGDFHQHIETKSGVAEKFERIDIEAPSKEATIRILEDVLHWLEPAYKVTVTYNALQKIVDLSDRFIYNKAFPEKAIDLLNELVVYVRTEGRDTIFPKDVETVISSKTKVPIGEGDDSEKERLLNLETFLHKRVIGQDIAINAVSNALRRARAGIRKGDKPIGSFLFLGPTGVGKTETSKALADAYFGDETRMIRFDMSEYQDVTGLYRLLGAPPGSPEAQSGGQLTNAVKDNPFSLVLFDEIEKADPNILNIFLQLLDEGWVTDSLGRKVKFNNAIIIATSNAGSDFIRESIQNGVAPEDLQESLLNHLQEKRLFRPEFLNRFTSVVNFAPLNPDQVTEITRKMLSGLIERIYQEKGVQLQVTEEALQKLAELGYDPLLGARPIQRVIQEKVENFLAKELLSDQVSRGEALTFDVKDIT